LENNTYDHVTATYYLSRTAFTAFENIKQQLTTLRQKKKERTALLAGEQATRTAPKVM